MAVQDLWRLDDGSPSKRDGRGRRWRVVVAGHPSRSFAAKKAAEAWERKLLAEEPETSDRTTPVGELLDSWLKGKAHLSPKGIEAAKLAARAVRARWGGTAVVDVTREDVQAWISGEVGSPSRKHKLAQCMAGTMALAVARGIIKANPADKLSLPPQRPREPVYLDEAHVAAIASHAHGWGMGRAAETRHDGWYAPMVWLMVTTAARIGEACALDVGDVTRRRVGGVERWRVRVGRSKSGVGRDLPLPDAVAAMLDLSRPKTDPLFVTPLGSRINSHNWRSRVWRPACAAAKVEITPHGLRHTAISWAIADGADVKAVQRMAGHKRASVTLDVYGHLWDQGLDDVGVRMGQRIGAVVPTPSD